ncbi:aspC [Acrasis kona]|uniref:AspC n=1 Tax=Acrasis kona TaxID=1008807 RepID=A0AAW2ZD47_9EUKA
MTRELSISTRSKNTDYPTISAILNIASKQAEPVSTLCQGLVYWVPPEEATQTLDCQLRSTDDVSQYKKIHGYTPDYGTDDLRGELIKKLQQQNNLTDVNVIVTAGANQGFSSIVSCLCDVGDAAVLFRPYYFNHIMALQLSNVEPVLIDCSASNQYLPNPNDIRKALEKNLKN